MASAVHVMSFVARAGAQGSNSQAIARSLKTNPVFVRRILKSLEKGGLVLLRRGRNGGVALSRAPKDVLLGQIYGAIENDGGVFALRENVNPRCPVARGMGVFLPAVFDAANKAVEDSLNQVSLETLVQRVG